MILNKTGRMPFILYPNMCCRCGKLWPEMFRVPDTEWREYVAYRQRNKMLCFDCFMEIRHLIQAGTEKRFDMGVALTFG